MPEAQGTSLVVVAGRATGSRLEVGTEPIVIGRASDGPAALDGDPESSRRHARIGKADGALVIEDLGSVNGTFVNGDRISEPTPLAPGDSVWIGMTTLVVTAPDGPVPDVPPVEAPVPIAGSGPLRWLADIVGRRPGRVLAAVGIFFVFTIVFGAPVGGKLHANDAFEAKSSESVKTDDRIAQATGEEAGPQLLAVVRTGQPVDSQVTRAKVAAVAAQIKQGKGVTRVVTPYNSRAGELVS